MSLYKTISIWTTGSFFVATSSPAFNSSAIFTSTAIRDDLSTKSRQHGFTEIALCLWIHKKHLIPPSSGRQRVVYIRLQYSFKRYPPEHVGSDTKVYLLLLRTFTMFQDRNRMSQVTWGHSTKKLSYSACANIHCENISGVANFRVGAISRTIPNGTPQGSALYPIL